MRMEWERDGKRHKQKLCRNCGREIKVILIVEAREKQRAQFNAALSQLPKEIPMLNPGVSTVSTPWKQPTSMPT